MKFLCWTGPSETNRKQIFELLVSIYILRRRRQSEITLSRYRTANSLKYRGVIFSGDDFCKHPIARFWPRRYTAKKYSRRFFYLLYVKRFLRNNSQKRLKTGQSYIFYNCSCCRHQKIGTKMINAQLAEISSR